MSLHQVFGAGSALVVAAVLIAGFVLSGAPSEQRLLRIDQQRVGDLQQLASHVNAYAREHDRLPDALEQLVDGRRLSELPVDPITGNVYRYEATEQGYQLCATFDRASEFQRENFWAHPAGERCYGFALPEP